MSEWVTVFPCQQLDCLGEGSSIQMGKMKKAVFDSILGEKSKKKKQLQFIFLKM